MFNQEASVETIKLFVIIVENEIKCSSYKW